MKITSISYQAVKNLGNYESERLEATATIEDGEDPALGIQELRQFVNGQLLIPPDSLKGDRGIVNTDELAGF